MGLVESGWHGVGSIDRATGSRLLLSRSSFMRNGDVLLRSAGLAMIKIKINTFLNQKDPRRYTVWRCCASCVEVTYLTSRSCSSIEGK